MLNEPESSDLYLFLMLHFAFLEKCLKEIN